MTTTVKVHVNGNYKATVTKDDGSDPIIIMGTSEQHIYLRHPVDTSFHIKEVPMTAEEIAQRDGQKAGADSISNAS